jgi:hypothetical protein
MKTDTATQTDIEALTALNHDYIQGRIAARFSIILQSFTQLN